MSMSINKKNKQQVTDDDDSKGGKSGAIEFVEFIKTADSLRDDLPQSKVKQLLNAHYQEHDERVKKQKEERENRKAIKEGKKKDHKQGMLGALEASNAEYRSHPLLSESPQFSGIDKQVTHLPTENVADTNHLQRERLNNEYRLRYAPNITPQFNPKPNYP